MVGRELTFHAFIKDLKGGRGYAFIMEAVIDMHMGIHLRIIRVIGGSSVFCGQLVGIHNPFYHFAVWGGIWCHVEIACDKGGGGGQFVAIF